MNEPAAGVLKWPTVVDSHIQLFQTAPVNRLVPVDPWEVRPSGLDVLLRRTSIEDHDPFSGSNLPRRLQQLQGFEAGTGFRAMFQ